MVQKPKLPKYTTSGFALGQQKQTPQYTIVAHKTSPQNNGTNK